VPHAVAKRASKIKPKNPPPPGKKPERIAEPDAAQSDFPWAAAALLVAAVFIAYFPALRGGMLWDDSAHVTRPELQSLHGLWRVWFDLGATQQYYPLLHGAFWIEQKLWGEAPFYYHLLNVLLHTAAACLLLAALKRLKIPGAFLAAGIFALHPVYVESVAWITEQKNTLSAVFYFTSLLFYLRFDEERGARDYFCAAGFFVLALLSKTVTATLPAALLVIFWWKRGRLSWTRDFAPLLPWFALGAVAGLFTAWVERRMIGAKGRRSSLRYCKEFCSPDASCGSTSAKSSGLPISCSSTLAGRSIRHRRRSTCRSLRRRRSRSACGSSAAGREDRSPAIYFSPARFFRCSDSSTSTRLSSLSSPITSNTSRASASSSPSPRASPLSRGASRRSRPGLAVSPAECFSRCSP
jgi:hypothetical protein